MAVRRLVAAIEAIGANTAAAVGLRADMGALRAAFLPDVIGSPEQARVMAVGDQAVMVSFGARVEPGVQVTDEPLRAGQTVWAVRARDGAVLVLGSTQV